MSVASKAKEALCVACGKELAPVLAALGSLTCHDCRKPAIVARPGVAG